MDWIILFLSGVILVQLLLLEKGLKKFIDLQAHFNEYQYLQFAKISEKLGIKHSPERETIIRNIFRDQFKNNIDNNIT